MNDCGTGCPCDEDDASSVSSQSDSDQQVCCCCNFDPFDDDSPEQRIQDLSFALRKLSVMKCQMRKWRLERLQIESDNRSLRLTLQEYGVDADRVLKPDPMIVHFRTENARLQSRKEQLEDEMRDLNETLAERDCCGDNPCDAVAHLREKILGLRHRCAVEKRQLRETIANLQLRLQEAQDDSSCAALNRLRAKLRKLMKDGNRGDQPVPSAVGKSIETLVELSKSCDKLKKENERLLAEVETLKREIREDVDEQEKFMKEDDLERDAQEMKSFLKRVNCCEAEVAQMRAQLAEKDAIINDLEKKLCTEKRNSTQLKHDLDEMAVSQKALRAEIDNMKGELKDKDGEPIKSKVDNLNDEVGKLKAEIERLKAENERAKVDMNNMEKELKSLNQVRQSLLDNNNKLMEKLKESSEQVARLSEESKELKKERDSLKSDAALLKEESNKLREDMKQQTNEACNVKKENENLLNELNNLQNDLKKLRSEMDELLQKEKDELLNRIKSLEDALELEKKQLNEARQANESLIKGLEQQRAECQKCRNAIENLCGECEKLKVSGENAADQSKELQNKLDEVNEEKSQLAAEISKQNDCIDALNQQVEGMCANKDRLERELGDLKWQLDKLKKDMDNEIAIKNQLQMELDALKDELNKLKAAKGNQHNEAKQFQTQADKVRSEAEGLKCESSKMRRQSIQMKSELSKLQIASSDSGKLKEEVECLKKKLQKCLAEKKKSSQDVHAKSEPVEKEKSACKSVCTANDLTVRDEKERTGPIAKDKSNKMIFDGCGDFVSASKDLQCEMLKQIDAVDRIREFISYVQGDTTDRPEMLAKCLASGDNNKNWSAPEIRELFERSRTLSETISKTEEEVQSLENMARALGQENNDYGGADDFNAKAWLQSLTLTELAELHDRICLLTSSMVKHDEPNCGVYEEEDEPGDVVNTRIAALQRRIAEKQREAATRAAEMRRALMQEQLQLIKLSDDMNRERERNLALRLSVETDMPIELPLRGANASGTSACCARDDCLRVGCTAHR